MENAVEGLKLAFAVLLLTMALSLTIAFFSKARTTAEMVLQSSDKTAYYDYDEDGKFSISQDTTGNRIVGYETIIPTLYKYDKERYKVTFKKGTYDSSTGNVNITGPLSIYTTSSTRVNWNKNYTNDYDGRTTNSSTYNVLDICSFDIVEETQRNEPWVGSSEQIKLHLDAIFSGGSYTLPQNPSQSLSYSRNPLSNRNNRFVEQIGEIKTESNSDDTDGTESIIGNKTTTKRIITYILIN